MAKAIVKVLLKLIKGFLGVLLTPLNNVINSLFSSLFGGAIVLTPLTNLFAYILSIIGYVVDATAIPHNALAMVYLTIIFKISWSMATQGLKIAVAWYRALMP